jgi:hypothetical protein
MAGSTATTSGRRIVVTSRASPANRTAAITPVTFSAVVNASFACSATAGRVTSTASVVPAGNTPWYTAAAVRPIRAMPSEPPR